MISTPVHKPVFIVAGGPSLLNQDLSLLSSHFTIAINNSYTLLPKASIVYFTDNDWWDVHKEPLLLHPGIKIKGSLPTHPIKHPKVVEYSLVQAEGIVTTKHQLAHGFNSSYAAINLAVQLGFKEIYLLGVDMQWIDGRSHWHQDHHRVDNESVYSQMMDTFSSMVEPLERLGVRVINLSPQSRLEVFPKMTYTEALIKTTGGPCKDT